MVDQEDNGMDYKMPEETKFEVTAQSGKTLKGMRVVRVVFNTDPEALKAFNRHYGARAELKGPNARGTKYSYITDLDFKEGQFAVVETPHGGLTVVQVVEVGTELLFGELPGHKWIVSKVDYEDYLERAEREKRKKFLLDSLTSRAQELKNRQRLEDILSEDPQSQAMLAELKSLS